MFSNFYRIVSLLTPTVEQRTTSKIKHKYIFIQALTSRESAHRDLALQGKELLATNHSSYVYVCDIKLVIVKSYLMFWVPAFSLYIAGDTSEST